MIFEDKLQWGKHVEHVKPRAIKRLNFLKCLFRLRWGVKHCQANPPSIDRFCYRIWGGGLRICETKHPGQTQLDTPSRSTNFTGGFSGPLGAKEVLRQCLPPQSISNKLGNNPRAPWLVLKKTIERWKPNVKLNRHQQVVLSRLRMCHTHLNIWRENVRRCAINATTVTHFVFECTKFQSHHIKRNIT
jgi:hypothetical protein